MGMAKSIEKFNFTILDSLAEQIESSLTMKNKCIKIYLVKLQKL